MYTVDIATLRNMVRVRCELALVAYRNIERALRKFVHVENGRSDFLGEGYPDAFGAYLTMQLQSLFGNAATVSRLLRPPKDAPARARALAQALNAALAVNEELLADRTARGNLEHVDERIYFMLERMAAAKASQFSEGYVLTRLELDEFDASGREVWFCWAIVIDEMRLLTFNRASSDRDVCDLAALRLELRRVFTECGLHATRERALAKARAPAGS